jgi:hypothetical protein
MRPLHTEGLAFSTSAVPAGTRDGMQLVEACFDGSIAEDTSMPINNADTSMPINAAKILLH